VTDPNGNTRVASYPPAPSSPSGFRSGAYMSTDIRASGKPEQQLFSYVRDPNSGLLQSATDPLNRKTIYTYDSFGNTASITRLAGTPDAVTILYSHDPAFNQVTSITDPLQHRTSFS